MKRTRILVATLMLLVLTIGLASSSTTTRTVKARDAAGVAMVFTTRRHFRH